MVSSLLLPENQEKLIRIPKYHVIPGRLSAMDVGNIAVPQMARTANGQRLPIGIENGEFRVGGNLVTMAYIKLYPSMRSLQLRTCGANGLDSDPEDRDICFGPFELARQTLR